MIESRATLNKQCCDREVTFIAEVSNCSTKRNIGTARQLHNRVKENQLDAQLILSIFRQSVHVPGVSRPVIRRYSRMYTTIGTYCYFYMTLCCPGRKTVF